MCLPGLYNSTGIKWLQLYNASCGAIWSTEDIVVNILLVRFLGSGMWYHKVNESVSKVISN